MGQRRFTVSGQAGLIGQIVPEAAGAELCIESALVTVPGKYIYLFTICIKKKKYCANILLLKYIIIVLIKKQKQKKKQSSHDTTQFCVSFKF